MDVIAAALAAIALATLAGACAVRRSRRSRVLAAAGLEEGGGPDPRPGFRPFPPFAVLLAGLGHAAAPRVSDDTLRLLEASDSKWTPDRLQGLRMAVGAALALASLPLGLAALPLAPVLFAAGYHFPIMTLKRRRGRRWESIASDLPEVVDLMAVLCFSGESLLSAFRHAAAASGNPCSSREMERVLEHIDLGESTVGALRLAYDHPCREMRRFARTLIRAEEFGAPVADTLEELAVELRNSRREKDRARAARVSVLILLPLVFLILPSFLLLTVGGMILGYTL
ncbi:MAG: type II secretion system F family protein [Actinomycetota bacterium]